MNRQMIVEVMARASCRSLWEGEPPCRGICEACENGIKAALTALEAQGLVVVPREPTEEMVASGELVVAEWGVLTAPDTVYAAMLSASPGQRERTQ